MINSVVLENLGREIFGGVFLEIMICLHGGTTLLLRVS